MKDPETALEYLLMSKEHFPFVSYLVSVAFVVVLKVKPVGLQRHTV